MLSRFSFITIMGVGTIKKPNSLCKNVHCRKPFYACAYCTHKIAWRAVTCSPECFDAYMNQVAETRAANKKVNLLPERTDMTEEQAKELMAKPVDEVIATTKEELSEYAHDIEIIGLNGTIDKINDEIRSAEETEDTFLLSNTSKSNRTKKRC